MRRVHTVLLTAILSLALAAGAVTLASAGGGDRDSRGDRQEQRTKRADRDHGKRHHGKPHVRGRAHHALGRGIFRVVLTSLAGRLEVEPKALRQAIRAAAEEQRAAALDRAGLTDAERAALKSCGRHGLRRHGRRGGGCDRAALRSAFQKLKAAHRDPDLAQLKADLAGSLATKLGRTPDEVLAAVRAELAQRLDQAVAFGLVTAKGRELALSCFDAPASCDLEALRAETRFGRHHRRP